LDTTGLQLHIETAPIRYPREPEPSTGVGSGRRPAGGVTARSGEPVDRPQKFL